jgi:hypothetical protein
MSYLPNINPKQALETLGLRREDPTVLEVVLPGLGLFVLGACVGAGAALLFAPKSGRELRRDISAKASELKDTVRNALPMIHENGVDGVETASYQSEQG